MARAEGTAHELLSSSKQQALKPQYCQRKTLFQKAKNVTDKKRRLRIYIFF
jgi:hypothetical protein